MQKGVSYNAESYEVLPELVDHVSISMMIDGFQDSIFTLLNEVGYTFSKIIIYSCFCPKDITSVNVWMPFCSKNHHHWDHVTNALTHNMQQTKKRNLTWSSTHDQLHLLSKIYHWPNPNLLLDFFLASDYGPNNAAKVTTVLKTSHQLWLISVPFRILSWSKRLYTTSWRGKFLSDITFSINV